MKIVAISDTHALHNQMLHPMPEGDVLVHAGDLTNVGELKDVESFCLWSKTLPFVHKVAIAGNHDFCFDQDYRGGISFRAEAITMLEDAGWIYLFDSSIEIKGVKFYGSPWQPWFYDWAFNKQRGQELAEIWSYIPKHTDVLVTHGPPMGILDQTLKGDSVGCKDLLERIDIIKPKLHIFGHIHEAYGELKISDTVFLNAAVCNLQYQPINKPHVYDYAL